MEDDYTYPYNVDDDYDYVVVKGLNIINGADLDKLPAFVDGTDRNDPKNDEDGFSFTADE